MDRNDYPADAAPAEFRVSVRVAMLVVFALVNFAMGVLFCSRWIDAKPW